MNHAYLPVSPGWGDALVVTTIQTDFLSGGSLAVPGGDAVVVPFDRGVAFCHGAAGTAGADVGGRRRTADSERRVTDSVLV